MAKSKNTEEQVENVVKTEEVVVEAIPEWVVVAGTFLPSMIVKAKDKKEAVESYCKMLGVPSLQGKPSVTPVKKPKAL